MSNPPKTRASPASATAAANNTKPADRRIRRQPRIPRPCSRGAGVSGPAGGAVAPIQASKARPRRPVAADHVVAVGRRPHAGVDAAFVAGELASRGRDPDPGADGEGGAEHPFEPGVEQRVRAVGAGQLLAVEDALGTQRRARLPEELDREQVFRDRRGGPVRVEDDAVEAAVTATVAAAPARIRGNALLPRLSVYFPRLSPRRRPLRAPPPSRVPAATPGRSRSASEPHDHWFLGGCFAASAPRAAQVCASSMWPQTA